MSSWKPEDVQSLVAEVMRRSAVDTEFRALALSDSAAALNKAAGRPAPSDLKIEFIENSGSTQKVVLPNAVEGIEELNEEEMEQVAGGVEAVRWSAAAGISGS
jgi:hypothetical protein